MTAKINEKACIRCGLCAGLCPGVFTAPENGEPARAAEGEITGQEEQLAAQTAADSCPTAAITIK